MKRFVSVATTIAVTFSILSLSPSTALAADSDSAIGNADPVEYTDDELGDMTLDELYKAGVDVKEEVVAEFEYTEGVPVDGWENEASESLRPSIPVVPALGARYGPCTLDLSRLYVRGSTKGIGFKATTRCSTKVTSIKHTSKLGTRNILGYTKVRKTINGPGNRGQSRYEQKNISMNCKGTKSTRWVGQTLGTMVYKGRTYYARNYNGPTKEKCGV